MVHSPHLQETTAPAGCSSHSPTSFLLFFKNRRSQIIDEAEPFDEASWEVKDLSWSVARESAHGVFCELTWSTTLWTCAGQRGCSACGLPHSAPRFWETHLPFADQGRQSMRSASLSKRSTRRPWSAAASLALVLLAILITGCDDTTYVQRLINIDTSLYGVEKIGDRDFIRIYSLLEEGDVLVASGLDPDGHPLAAERFPVEAVDSEAVVSLIEVLYGEGHEEGALFDPGWSDTEPACDPLLFVTPEGRHLGRTRARAEWTGPGTSIRIPSQDELSDLLDIAGL